MNSLKIAVCDDEKETRVDLERLVKTAFPDFIVETFSSGNALLSGDASFDVYLLDIDLPEENGMEIAKRIRRTDKDAFLIFVTGYDNYMQDAFDVRAFHYLLKPVREEKLRNVLSQVMAEKERRENADRKSVLLKTAGISKKVRLHDIVYLESNNKKVVFHLADDSLLDVYAKMDDMERLLGSAFFRCHRAYIVNMKYITAYSADEITMNGTQKILMSHRRYAGFVKAYLRYAKKDGVHVAS